MWVLWYFHRRVWYRALSLRYVRIRSSGIILIPRLGYLRAKFSFFRGLRSDLTHGEKSRTHSLSHSLSLLFWCVRNRSLRFGTCSKLLSCTNVIRHNEWHRNSRAALQSLTSQPVQQCTTLHKRGPKKVSATHAYSVIFDWYSTIWPLEAKTERHADMLMRLRTAVLHTTRITSTTFAYLLNSKQHNQKTHLSQFKNIRLAAIFNQICINLACCRPVNTATVSAATLRMNT